METADKLAIANPGLPQIASYNSGATMVLFSACDPVATVVDGAPPGPNGRLFKIPVNKPVKVPYEAGRFILDHLGYTGVVRVREEETETGITYHVDEAREESLAKGRESDEMRFRQYVSDTVQDCIRANKVPPPPSPAIQAIIERRGYKIQDYGIKPVGFQDPEDARRKKDAEDKATMQSTIDRLQAQLDTLIKIHSNKPDNPADAEELDDESPTASNKGQVRKKN